MIKRELIVTYNLEENGVVERKNISIEESVKEMLHDQDLLKFMLGEATKTVVYIQNRIPHGSCCSDYNHPPIFFLSLFWSLPTNLSQHFVLLHQVLKL